MSTSVNNIDYLLKNPLQSQSLALADLQAKLGNGGQIVDGNNVPCFMLETMCNLVSDSVREMIKLNNDSYSIRASVSGELYRHMSQWDYVGLYSTPSQTTIRLHLDKNYIIANAKQFNSNYNKVIIPASTKFKIANIDFGIYYPIEIKVNRLTKSFLISHDTSVVNPLHVLVDNTINHQDINQHDMGLIFLEFPVYQFTRSVYIEPLISGNAYNNKWELVDNFYALVIEHYKDNKWVEINQTLSDMSYDPFNPTAKLKMNLEKNEVSITIPQIYFSNESIGSKLKVTIYETKGEVDLNIGNLKQGAISLTMGDVSEVSLTYTEILNRIPTMFITPTSSRIAGGANGWSFEELRQKVINNEFSTEAAITLPRMKNLFTNNETTVTQKLDNITSRIFIAHSPIKDIDNKYLSAGKLGTYLNEEDVTNCFTINRNIDTSITILPATLYKLDGSMTKPVLDTELNIINTLSLEQKVNLFNESQYTFSPYHLRLSVEDEFPVASLYNLINPTITEIVFVSENMEISTQLSITNGIVIQHLKGTTGFTIRVGVLKSDDLIDVDESNIRIRGMTSDPNSIEKFYIDAVKYVEQNGITYYDFLLTSDYDINNLHRILITSFERLSGGGQYGCFLNLNFKLNVHLEVKAGSIPGLVPVDPEEFIPTIEQNLTINLGRLLNSVINPSVDVNYTNIQYQTYLETTYKKYTSDVYEFDEDGKLVYTVVGDEVILNKLHSIGDDILTEQGYPIVEHLAGTNVLDYAGNPIISRNRDNVYVVDMLHIDNRLLYTDSVNLSTIGVDISNMLDYYLEELARVQTSLLEKTYMHFEPIRTIGNGTYVTKNNSTITQPLNISIHLVLYVTTKTLENTVMLNSLKLSIIDIITKHVDSGMISLALIQDEIIKVLGDEISSVDNFGINGNPSLQTLVNRDNRTKSIIARKLTFNTDNTVEFKEDLTLEFTSYQK